MQRYLFIPFFIFFTGGIVALQAQRLSYKQGEMIIQLQKGTDGKEFANKQQRYRGKLTYLEPRDLLSSSLNIWKFKFDFAAVHDRNFLFQIQKDPKVVGAQFNHFVQLRSTTPNDNFFEEQWHYINNGQSGGAMGADLDIDLAWDLTTGGLTAAGDTIVVCVIDNGQDIDHEDFEDNLWINYAEIPGNGIDDDGNGYTDDYRGWHTGKGTDEIDDANFHGTPVSGIIGAKGNNGLGVAGINWDIKLMIVTAGFFGQSADEAQLIEAYNYALVQRKRYNETEGREGAFVVATNSSFGIARANPAEFSVWCGLFDELGKEGILGPSATADTNIDVDMEGDVPTGCSSDFVISVTNVDDNAAKVNNAGFGAQSIDLGAFGGRRFENSAIWTTSEDNSYDYFDGTSASTPMVSGAIALLYAAPCSSISTLAKADPPAAALLVKQYILDGVVPNPTLDGITLTGGHLNINNSMQLLMQNCSDCIASTSIEVENTKDVEVTVNWNTNPTIKRTDLRWKKIEAVEWNEVDSISAPYILKGLTPCTAYELQLREFCEAEALDFSESINFQTEGCCAAPAQVTFEIIEENLVLVSWPEVFGAVNYDFRYRELDSQSWLGRTSFGTNFLMNNLDSCTTYEVQIAVSCDGADNFGAFSEAFMVTTLGCGSCLEAEYCEPNNVDSSEEWIAMVKIDEFENRSQSDGGYGDFTGLSLELEQGRNYEFTVEPGFAPGISRSQYTQLWMDLDQNGSFTTNERLYASVDPSNEAVNISMFIPEGTKLGRTRLRIGMHLQNGVSACSFASNQFGEFEDYCVDIIERRTTSVNNAAVEGLVFNVYPNPASPEEVTLQTQFSQPLRDYYLEWIRSDGTFIRSIPGKNHPANVLQSQRLDISDFVQGIYFLRLRSNGRKTLVKKVIVTK